MQYFPCSTTSCLSYTWATVYLWKLSTPLHRNTRNGTRLCTRCANRCWTSRLDLYSFRRFSIKNKKTRVDSCSTMNFHRKDEPLEKFYRQAYFSLKSSWLQSGRHEAYLTGENWTRKLYIRSAFSCKFSLPRDWRGASREGYESRAHSDACLWSCW